MPVTSVTQMRSRAGRADAVIAAVAEHFDRVLRPCHDCEMSYLFQGLDDPDSFLHVVAWRGSPEEAEKTRPGSLPPLDLLLAGSPTVRRARQIETHERIGVRIGAIGCMMVEGPAEHADRLREAVVEAAHGTLHDWSETRGLVLYRVYQDDDRPADLAIVHCWERPEDLAAFEAACGHLVGPAARALGAEVERFAGECRAIVSRLFSL